jgi:dolichol-phosphate mannosyltransferase
MLVSIVIPVFNESKTIFQILKKINQIKGFKKEIIIIDDGSTDDTKKIVKKKCFNLYSKFISYRKNRGKGYACRKGLSKVRGDIVIIQDADLEYSPKDYPKLIKPIIKKKTKIVYGSRVLAGGVRVRPKSIDVAIRLIANHFLTFLSNMLNNHNLTDAHTCYKVFDTSLLKKISLQEDGFNFCPEITAQFSKINEKIYEVPVDYYGRTHEEGKKISFFDGFRAIYAIIKYNIFL